MDERRLTGPIRDFVPLTSAGEVQASALSRDLHSHDVQIILSSPYTRALQTAAILSRKLDKPLHVEFDLREWTPDKNGCFATYEKLQAIYQDFNDCDGVYPDGEERVWETRASVTARTMSVLKRFMDHDRVAVVCHGMVIQLLTGCREIRHAERVEFVLHSGHEA